MPDQDLILKASFAAALVAAAIAVLGRWRPRLAAVAGALGVGLGFFLGCRLVGAHPHWPPREDQDRFLYLLLPAVVVAELLASILGKWRWLPRLPVAVLAGRVLLHSPSFVGDFPDTSTREWTPAQTWAILAGLGVALAGVWMALAELTRRAPGRAVPLAVSGACAGAAVTIMFSGYASGGMLGLPLAAAVAGSALVAPGRPGNEGAVGLGVVGLFALLVAGRFFGSLTTLHACVLFAAPLVAWLPELPGVRRLGPRLRGPLRLALVALPVVAVLVLARQQFVKDSSRIPGADPTEPTLDDYLNFGK